MLDHEAVRECAVTGVPDPLRGHAVKATVVLAEPFKPSDDLTKELQTWVKNQTAPYKYPRVIGYVDKLPRTVNGKIRRGIIRGRRRGGGESGQRAAGAQERRRACVTLLCVHFDFVNFEKRKDASTLVG